jgi:hypothetical protein
LAGLLLAALPNAAAADELSRLNQQILRNPTNSELNLRYARLAEERKEWRWALAAYERILVNDPGNEEARWGLVRVRRKLQPNQTQVFAEFGGAWESNPRRVSTGAQSEWEAIARVMVRDERALGDTRWRTTGTFIAEAHQRNSDLNYGYAGGLTGPVIDLTPRVAMFLGLGGGAALFDQRFFYSEAIASAQFESYLEGAFQTVRVRAGYRKYNEFFPSDEGFYADVIGRFSFPAVLASNDLFVVNPWFRWSGIGGEGITITFEQVQPGKYIEYGGRLEYYRRVLEWLTIGGSIGILGRDYAESINLVTLLPSTRRDVTVFPGATVIVHHVFGHQHDIRFDYRYEDNRSSDPLRDYVNHLVSMLYVVRF